MFYFKYSVVLVKALSKKKKEKDYSCYQLNAKMLRLIIKKIVKKNFKV